MLTRCPWTNEPLMNAYHDTEWGVPVHDDRRWFQDIILDGAQAGLSWSTILKRRAGYQRAFEGFDPAKVALYGESDVERLLNDPGIIRNRLKVNSAIKNAQAFLAVQQEFGTFDAYIWRFVDGKPIKNACKELKDIGVTSPESDALSKDLKQRGFTFVGSTIVYALMQATGMVNDHLVTCFRYDEVG